MTTETITNDETRVAADMARWYADREQMNRDLGIAVAAAAAAKGYNGWKNRQTWNCALWIENEEPLYRAAVAFMRKYKGRAPYCHFINSQGMENDKTPDGYKWLSNVVCLLELNDMMRELIA